MSNSKAILFGPLPLPIGGVAIVMSALKDPAFALGADVWSYTGDGGDARVVRVSHRALGHVWRLLRRGDVARVVDASHFHLEYPHWLLLPAWLLLKRLKGFRWIKTCHDGSLPFRYPAMNDADRRRFKKALAAIDEMVVPSQELIEFFRDKFTGPIRRVSPLMPLPASWGSNIDTADRKARTVISIGAFIPSYGFHDVVAAVEALRQNGQDVDLMLLDGAFAREDAYREALLANRPWITVHEGVPHSTLGDLFGSTDLLVRAFAHESYGLSRVDAILAGVPVIATDLGETRGMLTYDFGDVATLQRHIESILYGDVDFDLAHWSDVYRREAAENLETYLRLITGETDA